LKTAFSFRLSLNIGNQVLIGYGKRITVIDIITYGNIRANGPGCHRASDGESFNITGELLILNYTYI